jgi:3-hydroxyisobutyrate dehydrogenase-like beta-hydroxyacid dehydrogenase
VWLALTTAAAAAAVYVPCRDSLNQALPVAAAANEAYKQAKSKGYGDADFAAVYEATQISGVSLN